MFRDREDAAERLARRFKGRKFRNPLVLAIPRGGVVMGAVLARALGAELDVVLARKLRAPGQPELAIGAISEDGQICFNEHAREVPGLTDRYLVAERRQQLAEIMRRRELFRGVRPPAPIAGRSVLVTDDGLATGSTMIAALRVVEAQKPHELLVAVPVGAADRVAEVRTWCDEVICLLMPEDFHAIGQYYEDFAQVSDEEVVEILGQFAPVAESVGTT